MIPKGETPHFEKEVGDLKGWLTTQIGLRGDVQLFKYENPTVCF
jgi:hypothetical protein